jgi:hypothetical protein
MALAAWSLLTMDEAKEIVQPGNASEDVLIEAFVHAATLSCERETARKLVSRTYTNEVYHGTGSAVLKLREYPVTSVSALSYLTTEVPAAWTARSLTDSPVTIVEPVSDVILYRNSVFDLGVSNVRLTYVAGLTSPGEDVKSAARIILLDLWKQRDKQLAGVASTSFNGQTTTYMNEGIPKLAARLLEPYKRMAA